MTQYGTLHDVNKKQLYVNFFQELTFLLIFLLTESTFFLQIGQLESTFFRKLHFPEQISERSVMCLSFPEKMEVYVQTIL